MVLWMNNEKARKHLLEKGVVYSRRPKRRHREDCFEPLFYNEFKKKGTVFVNFIKGSGPNGEIIDRERMKIYLSRSGFDSIEEWDEASHNSSFVYLIDLSRITEKTDLHPRVMKRHYVEAADAKWEVSTVRLVEEPMDPLDIIAVMRDVIDDIHWKYETMIFKHIEEGRDGPPDGLGSFNYGHYRSDDSPDIVKAHDQIVSLIAEGKLTPVRGESTSQISAHILKTMMKESIKVDKRRD